MMISDSGLLFLGHPVYRSRQYGIKEFENLHGDFGT